MGYAAIGMVFVWLFLMGLLADTRSVQRDIDILERISVIQSVVGTNQEAVIRILNSLNNWNHEKK